MCKKCFKCGEVKLLSEFHKHKQMRDGHLNKCKDCAIKDSKDHRANNIDKVRAYDRARGNRQSTGYLKEYRKNNPKKYRATNMINNAVRSGRLHSESCVICGEIKTVAHHDDYDKPLNVRWLCQAHHKQWHAANGAGANG
jgi:hypothetical protein